MILHSRPWLIRFSAALLALNVLEILPNCNAGDYSLNAVGGDSAWQTTEFTAHAELAPGTIVPIYAPFTFYVYYVEELSMGTRNVRNLQFMVDVHGDLYNNGGQVGLEGGSVNPFFTASGTSDGNVYDANGQIVGTADAPSYTSLHTYSPTYSGNEWLTVDIPVVVSFDAKPCLNPRAAGVLNPKVDSLNVSMSLGSGGNGSLRVLADTPNSALGSPKFLETLAVTSDFEVLKVPGPAADAGNLRQVLTPKALVQVSRDAEDGTNYLYKIDFYPRPPNPTKGADGFYIIPTGTNWFKEIQIENPTSGGQPDYSSLYVTETAGGISRQTQYSYSSTENKWTMLAPDSLAKETATVVSDTGSERVEEKSIYKPAQPADQLVAKVKNKFHLVGGAKLLVEETVNPDGMARTNTWTYGETSGQLEYKKVTKFIRFDSYWERYEYSPLPTGATYYQKKITPLNNATDTAAESLCRVIETVYYSNINGAGVWTVTEKVLSEVVSIKYKGRQSTSPKEIHEVEYATATIPTPWDSASAGNLLTTTTIDDFARPTTITYPNGTVGFFTYATPSGGLQTIETLGQPSSNGTAVQEGVKTITLVGPVGEMKSVYRYAITNGVDGPELSHDLYSYPIADDYFQISPTIQYLDGTTTSGSQCSCGFQSPQSTTDKDGTVTYYTYDTMNRQIATQTLGITTTNLLDSAGKTLATIRIGTNGSWNILQQTAYDVAGRISKSTNALNGVTTFSEGIDGNGYFVKTNGFPDGGTRIESYFKDGSLAKLTGTAVHPSRYVQGVELESNTNRFFTQEIKLDAGGNDTSEWTKSYYDMLKRRYKTVFSKSGTPYPFSQSFYNVQGQLWKQVDPDGVATLSQYNPKGELAYIAVDTNRNDVIDFAGNDRVTWTTNFVASKNGMTVLRTQRDVWPAGGVDASNLVSTVETSADGLRTWNILWNAGAGMTNQSQTVYAGSGNRYVTNTAPDGSYTLTAYSYGRLGSATRFSSTSAQLGKTTYTYDAHGRVLTTTDARNGATPYGYNNADQLTSVTTPPPGIGQGSQTTTTYFDNMGRATNVFLADLTTVTNEYYLTGELRKTFGSRSYPVGYGYDAQGRMKTMTNWTTFPNSGTRITTWNYDGYRGFLTNKVYDGGNAGPSYGYTPAGRLLSRAWARGITTTNSYNNNGDLSSTSYSDSTPSVAMGYDRRGRATTVTNGTAVCSLTFNDANQMLSETNSAGTLVGLRVTNIFDNFLRRTSVSALSSTSQLLSSNAYAFDYASRLTNVTDGTYSAGYTYLANSPLISQITLKSNTTVRMTTTKQYDYLNRLLSISSSPSSSSSLPLTYAYAYNDANQRTRVTLNDGSFWIYQYDSLGQVISSKKSWGDGTPVPGQQFEYGFDNIGNRTSTKAGGDQSGAGLRPATYSANSLNQYTSRTVPSAFDALGIATASASVTVNGSPADYRRGEYFQEMISVNNSSTSVWQNVSVTTSGGGSTSGNVLVPTATESYGFDADGNMTNDGRWTFTWDGENRLVSMQALSAVPSGAKKKLDFTYDYGGRRTQKIVSTWNISVYVATSTNKFLYDGWNLVAELNGTNGLIRSYLWGTDLSGGMEGAGGVGGLLAMKPTGTSTLFVAYDGNGNVTGLIDATTGTTTGNFEYGPFGETIRLTPNANNQSPFRFSTKYTDDESDFLYYGFRYYNPSTGKWLSRDPLGEATSLNLTSFLDNNSVNAHDVLGLYNSAGHFHTTYLVARAAGYTDQRAFELAYWSQYPDQNLNFAATEQAMQLEFGVGEYLHSLTGGDAKKLRSYLACLLKSGQFNDAEKGLLIHALGDAYAHSYRDWNSWQGSPKQGRPNPRYGQEVLYPPPFGHFFSGHMPDYIASKPETYGNYVDQLYGVLSDMNDGGTTHPEWVAALKDQANTFSKPNFAPDFFSAGNQNQTEVDALRSLPGGYGSSSQDYNPDFPRHSVMPDMTQNNTFRGDLIERIKKGVKGCCPIKIK